MAGIRETSLSDFGGEGLIVMARFAASSDKPFLPFLCRATVVSTTLTVSLAYVLLN